jgi:hypothetical protein
MPAGKFLSTGAARMVVIDRALRGTLAGLQKMRRRPCAGTAACTGRMLHGKDPRCRCAGRVQRRTTGREHETLCPQRIGGCNGQLRSRRDEPAAREARTPLLNG